MVRQLSVAHEPPRKRWVVALAISTGYPRCNYAAQFDFKETITEQITTPGSTVIQNLVRYVYENGTEVRWTETCPDGTANPATCTMVGPLIVYPDLGICAFRYYRVRMYPAGTDATDIAPVTEVVLWLNKEPLEGSYGMKPAGVPVEVYKDPQWAVDGKKDTTVIDLDFGDLYIEFLYNVLADEACIDIGRKPPGGIEWSVDAAQNSGGPWYIRLNRSVIEADAGYQQCFPVPTDYKFCRDPAAYISPLTVPEGWQLLNGIPTACMEREACMFNGTCAPFNDGPLCHQCSSTYAGLNGTRYRTGDRCESCPDYWIPIVRGILFILFYLALGLWLISEQYIGSVEPWKFQHALEIEEILDLPQKAFPHLYAMAIIRVVFEHQVLVATAWAESGLFQALPSGSRSLAQFIIMDWFRFIQVQCVIPTWDVPDQYYAAHACIGGATLLTFIGGYLFIKQKRDNNSSGIRNRESVKWQSLREAPAAICLLLWRGIVSFFKCLLCFDKDPEDAALRSAEDAAPIGTGKFTRDGVTYIKKPHWWEKGPPKIFDCTMAVVVLLNFLQLPLFLHSFTIYLDCVDLQNKQVLRADLTVRCDGSEWAGHVVANIAGILVWFICMPVGFAVVIGANQLDEERGLDTSHSAYGFIVGGLRPKRWWFAIWKMVLKELLVVAVLLSRIGDEPRGPGFGNAPGLLALFGAFFGGAHIGLQPYDPDRPLLTLMEGLTWAAFMAAPLTRLLLGLDAAAASFQGEAYITRYIAEVDNVAQWLFMSGTILLYLSVPVVGAVAVLEDEYNWAQPPKVKVEIAERVHIQMPENRQHRRWIANIVARMFKCTIHGHIDQHDKVPGRTIAPSALLEAALILTAKEQAKEDGREGAAEVEIEKQKFLQMLERIDDGEETDRLLEHRAVLEPGGLAEATLASGMSDKQKGKGKGARALAARIEADAGVAASPRTDGGSTAQQAQANNVNSNFEDYTNDVHDGIHTFKERKVIMFSFAIECVDLKSLGFRAGEGSDSNAVRMGVKNALERGIAAAAAATEADVDVQIHPVGLDRALVIGNVKADGQDEEVQLRIREEWLRNTLGNREGRARWGLAVEKDLARVGCVSAPGFRMQVRFTRGSRPQRMAESLAAEAAQATVAAASSAAATDNRPEPTHFGRLGHGNIDDEEEVWNRGAPPQGRLANMSSAGPTNARTKKSHEAQMRAKTSNGMQRLRAGRDRPMDDDEISDYSAQDDGRRGRSASNSRRPGPRRAGRSSGTPAKPKRRAQAQSAEADLPGNGNGNGEAFSWNMV